MRYRDRHTQSGVALITVLLIVALATIAATEMVTRQRLEMRRMRSHEALEQARFVALGAEYFAANRLYADPDKEVDSRLDVSYEVPPTPIVGGYIAGSVQDLQGRFNLNNLLTDDGKLSARDAERLRRLLEVLELNPDLVPAIQDWMDEDVEASPPNGAEDEYYSNLERPYRTANRRLMSVSELRLIRGINDETYVALKPHVTALPRRTSINVNTATMAVMQALAPHIDETLATTFEELTTEQAFESVQDFVQHTGHGGVEFSPEGLSVNSNYFLVLAQAEFGPVNTTLFSWMERRNDGTTRVFQRSRGIE